MGGISRFVPAGSTVVIKPNAAWARTPEQAGNTNPEVVSSLVKLCLQAKAKRVIVLDRTLDHWKTALSMSGIGKAAETAGAEVVAAQDKIAYAPMDIPEGKKIRSELVARDVLNADVLINVPIAKHHGSTEVTLGLKNFMGPVWNRGTYHALGLHQCIADLGTALRADLTIIDAYRVLLTNGPKGPGDVAEPRTIVVSTDPLASDVYACRFLKRNPQEVQHLVRASELGVGKFDLSGLKMKELRV